MSLKDSKDPIEHLYGNVILRYFPHYEAFWLKFIGNPRTAGPYGYLLPSCFNEDKKMKILEAYEKIQMWHYSLFCHLAGAHFSLEALKYSLRIKDDNLCYFKHWEFFDVGYMHLGSVLYYYRCLWNEVMKIRDYPNKYREIEQYLKGIKKDPDLLKRFFEVKTSVKNRRDQAVHYGRIFAFQFKGKYYIPCNAKRDMKWSEASKTTEWLDSVAALKEDIRRTEESLNDLHEILIAEYQEFISSNGITITRD